MLTEVRDTFTQKGRGIYARCDIIKGQVIEESVVILLSSEDSLLIRKTFLYNYFFEWGSQGVTALGLGNISLYNHSPQPNAKHVRIFEKQKMRIIALRNISAGEEICINYVNAYNKKVNRFDVWFEETA